MKMHWTDWAVTAIVVGAGCAVIYAGLTRAMRRVLAERQRDTDRQLNAMAAQVKVLQARVAELSRLEAGRAQEGEVTAMPAKVVRKEEATKPELVAVLTAAATAYLGKKTRLRSAQLLPAQTDSAGAWARQGRILVQTSHNLRSRK